MNLNDLGAVTLVVSGVVLLFAILTGLMGLPLRTVRNLMRSLVLEWIDSRTGRRGKSALSVRAYRLGLSLWVPARSGLAKITGLHSRGIALELSRQALYVNAGIVGLALLLLVTALGLNDMSNQYVVMHSAANLSIFYRITAAWAGASGSLLFWYFLLTLFTAIVLYQSRGRLNNRQPVIFLILGMLQLLFAVLVIFFEDGQPFRTFAMPMKAGRGLNPLLLHWAMIIHPPILYIGYVAFAIPFAIYASAAIGGTMHDDLLPTLRRWTLFSWFFLGFGILLGSKWAYEELGWGGYWAWDPVENASLMPFLLATAFLHSLIVQEHRGMLRFWNFFLIAATHHFCLLGTWITRSGVLQGPHSFAESIIGKPMIAFILLSFAYFLRFLYFRRRMLRPDERLESVTSKEGSMLLNNFLMVFAVGLVLYGVFSPMIPLDCSFKDGFQCFKTEWKPATFNKLMLPLGILVLFLMGASPLLAWRKGVDAVYGRTLRKPLIFGILVAAAYGAVYRFLFTPREGENNSPWGPQGIAEFFAVIVVAFSAFLVAGIVQEYARGIRSRRMHHNETWLRALGHLIAQNRRRYGGYLVHVSVVFLFIGFSGGAFKSTGHMQFHYHLMDVSQGAPYVYYFSGDKAYIGDNVIEARELFIRPHYEPNADQTKPADMTVSEQAHFRVQPKDLLPAYPPDSSDPYDFAMRPAPVGERAVKFLTGFVPDGRMVTERRFYPQIYPYSGEVQRDQNGFSVRMNTSEPDMKSDAGEDLYVQLGGLYDPTRNHNPELPAFYEFYLYELKKDQRAYEMIFPQTLIADVQYWINPLVKFIWIGTTLFFFSGLLLIWPSSRRKSRSQDRLCDTRGVAACEVPSGTERRRSSFGAGSKTAFFIPKLRRSFGMRSEGDA